ncbi:MAG: 4Fe-4S ferredoxin [Chloroflexi bacterium]|nr:4Fe-4S ferredoxin [Chloroflexota bacterium]
MTGARILAQDQLGALLDAFIARYLVYAPAHRGGVTRFAEIASADEATLSLPITNMSLKELFLPQTETLFTFTQDAVEDHAVEGSDATRERVVRVVFGVRPCDAASLRHLDAVFLDTEPADPHYAARRASTRIIGLACDHPLSTCFCTSVGGGPHAQEGMDILLYNLGNRFLARPVSEAGEQLMERIAEPVPQVSEEPALWAEATDGDLEEATRRAQEAEARVRAHVPTEGLRDKLAGLYDDPLWDALHQKCIGCGVCSYLCPTCHCFDVVDETNGRRGRRARVWDSCQYALFTLHASGHNPRPSGKERMRQRIMHKFRYFVDNYGQTACVGCGRCVRNCPVNVDIRQVLEAVMAV